MAMDHDAVLNAPGEDRTRILQEICEGSGADGLIAWLSAARSDETRRKLFGQAQQQLDLRSWPAGNLDDYIQVSRAGIAEYVRQSDELALDDPQLSVKLLDSANAMSYNLSASLADCWPGDELPRERRHHSEGFNAAENCVRWRQQLGKGPYSLQMAYWAGGVHLLALEDLTGALQYFEQELEAALAYSREQGKSEESGAEADFCLLLAHGCRGIARMLSGDREGQAEYEAAMDAFNEQLASDNSELREDAEIGLGQLRKLYQRRVLGLSAEA
ncbi:hypothetical protein IT575_03175 [bacterium]|nr:hypothetical protein [bacterium]